MKVLITGVAGFIGYHVAKALLQRGDKVVGIDNLNDYYDQKLKRDRLGLLGIDDCNRLASSVSSSVYSEFRFMQLDCANSAAVQELFAYERFDCVCHLAAQAGVSYSLEAPQKYVDSNITGFLSVLEGCRNQGIAHLLYASSSSVYGASEQYPYHTSNPSTHPVSLYAATKRANELFAHSYSHNFGIPTTGLRFFTVYGPWGRPDMAPMLFLQQMVQSLPIKVFNHGEMYRDFTYIDDIVRGVVLALDKPASSDPHWNAQDPALDSSKVPFRLYNIGRGAPVKLLDFIDALSEVSGLPVEKHFAPMRQGDVHTTHADTQSLVRDFSYQPTVSLLEGVTSLWDWYATYYLSSTYSEVH